MKLTWNKLKTKLSQLFLVQMEVLYNVKKVYQNSSPWGPLRGPQSSPQGWHFSKNGFWKGGPIDSKWLDSPRNTIVKMQNVFFWGGGGPVHSSFLLERMHFHDSVSRRIRPFRVDWTPLSKTIFWKNFSSPKIFLSFFWKNAFSW